MIDQFLIGDYRNFTYLVTIDGDSLVVDPQTDLGPWQMRLREIGATLKGVLLTHTHWDHIAGVPHVIAQYPDVPIYVHEIDARRLKEKETRVRIRHIKDNEKIPLGNGHVEVWLTPGHSAGECCYLVRENNVTHLLTGDTVFVGDVGRTDLETGSSAELFETIQRLKTLPADTIIYPGHDYGRTPTSTLAKECESSAAFKCKTVKELDVLP
jgi:glyoxylase-like metal-dependent hydrolase (beta-lactamase superfamily II)